MTWSLQFFKTMVLSILQRKIISLWKTVQLLSFVKQPCMRFTFCRAPSSRSQYQNWGRFPSTNTGQNATLAWAATRSQSRTTWAGTSLRLPSNPNTEDYTHHRGGKVGQQSPEDPKDQVSQATPPPREEAVPETHSPWRAGRPRSPRRQDGKGHARGGPSQVAAGPTDLLTRASPPLGAGGRGGGAHPPEAPPSASPPARSRPVGARASVRPASAPSQATRSGRDDAGRVCVLGGGTPRVCAREARVGEHGRAGPPGDTWTPSSFLWSVGPATGRGFSWRGWARPLGWNTGRRSWQLRAATRAAIKASRGFPPSQPRSDWSPWERDPSWLEAAAGAAPVPPGEGPPRALPTRNRPSRAAPAAAPGSGGRDTQPPPPGFSRCFPAHAPRPECPPTPPSSLRPLLPFFPLPDRPRQSANPWVGLGGEGRAAGEEGGHALKNLPGRPG